MKLDNIQPKPVVCRQSCITCAHNCETRWFLRYRLGVVLRGAEVKEGATLGKIYHKFQQLGPGKESEVLSWVRTLQTALMDKVQKGEDIDGSASRLANLLTDLYHKAEAMAHIFWERYPQPSYLKTIGAEIKVSVNVPPYPPIEGTIDKLLQNEQDGSFWIRDHKSTGFKTLDAIFSGLPWSIQGRIYRILASSHLTILDAPRLQHTLKGFILDGILHPGIKLCKTDEKNAKSWNCTSDEAYMRRVKEWYNEQGEQAILSKGIMYSEPLYSPELVRSLKLMLDLSERPINPQYYSRDVTKMACFQYMKQCVYHDLCDTPTNQWGPLFETKYKFSEPEKENESEESDDRE